MLPPPAAAGFTLGPQDWVFDWFLMLSTDLQVTGRMPFPNGAKAKGGCDGGCTAGSENACGLCSAAVVDDDDPRGFISGGCWARRRHAGVKSDQQYATPSHAPSARPPCCRHVQQVWHAALPL